MAFLWVDMDGIADWVNPRRMVRRDSTISLMELRVWELSMKVYVAVLKERSGVGIQAGDSWVWRQDPVTGKYRV